MFGGALPEPMTSTLRTEILYDGRRAERVMASSLTAAEPLTTIVGIASELSPAQVLMAKQ
jgi:hypothetical protein